MHSDIDIIIPIYNEAGNLRPLTERLVKSLKKAKLAFQLIFVDDHSSDTSVKVLKSLHKKYPIKILSKAGKKGKAYSILEGAAASKAPYVAMIDGDLQYPPEAIPEMLTLAKTHGVVVARRDHYKENVLRQTLSRSFQWFFGKFLHGLDCDVQSGLKVFKRDIVTHLNIEDISPWTLDIPLLTTALNLGYSIGEVNINFGKRVKGDSKIQYIKSIREIGGRAISHKLKTKKPLTILPEKDSSMMGAGYVQHGKKFVTHTTLPHHDSAFKVFTRPQRIGIYLLILSLIVFLFQSPLATAKIFVAILSTLYFLDVFFNLYVIIKSLQTPPEIDIPNQEVAALSNRNLPIYTVLCPLYKEAHVLPQFLEAIAKIDWPKSKLDVILLLEADDQVTIESAKAMKLPSYVSIRVVPDSQPKTKPKACNYGLHFAKGEYLVIFDAEDAPDPLQLKKVYMAFKRLPESVKCVQAKLNFYNPHQNLLTRFFTAEYSLWFDVVLTGLQSIQTTIPLGGTSNHFRTSVLRELQGWDPFNVTEDCDLGIRLFKRGGVTAIINSVTLEEANSSWRNWLRQRSRWIKGYMQTYLVHMRHPVQFFREQGMHAFLFQLIVGGKISFMLINPFMWLLTLTYFGLHAWAGPTIEALYPSVIFYMAVTSLLIGNFMFVYYYMIGVVKREHWSVVKWVFLVPFYWLMVSLAAVIALYQLIVKPHYWEKTVHGLHLSKELQQKSKNIVKDVTAEVATYAEEVPVAASQSLLQSRADVTVFGILKQHISHFKNLRTKLRYQRVQKAIKLNTKPAYLSGLLFLAASVGASIINMVINFYLGNKLSFAEFGTFNLMVSLFYFTSIPVQALGSTINYQSSYLLGKHNLKSLRHFRRYIHLRTLFVASIITVGWLVITPWLPGLFNADSVLPFVLFASMWLANLSLAVNSAYLSARLLFLQVAVLALLQPILRFLSAAALVEFSPAWTFVAIIIGLYGTAVVANLFARKGSDEFEARHEFHLPRPYFLASLVTGLSTIAFFSLDNLLVAHLTDTETVGRYAFMGLFGKMVFFLGSLTTTFLAPIVARKEGANQQTKIFFYLTLASVVVMTAIGYGAFIIAPYLWGEQFFGAKMAAVKYELLTYGIGIAAFTLAQVITSYHLVKKHYVFPAVALVLSGVEIVALLLFHNNLHQVSLVMTGVGILHLGVFSLLHWQYTHVYSVLKNVEDFKGLFQKLPLKPQKEVTPNALRILMLNWRDTKHVWAGGAEVYTQNIAQRLVERGHKVTIFCGNDNKSSRNEVVQGVEVIRRGGFYTVYFWAFIYYVFKLRGKFDVVIDCENGIPFLTPLYIRKPIFLLIYHVHRDVFREHLSKPLALVARFIEEVLMPLVYRERPLLTISESSKKEIMSLGISHPSQITIIHPGIELPAKKRYRKTKQPSMCYVGRLKAYKNVDTLIEAFELVLEKHPTATLTIAGSGESESDLKRLVKKLKLEKKVSFKGKITELEKQALYATSWLAVQPSMIEGWGITVIEANAMGTPVVASNVKGLRDSVAEGKTGVLVKTRDHKAFAKAITQLLSNKRTLQRLSLSARNWSQNFSWDQAAADMEKAIKPVAMPQKSRDFEFDLALQKEE